MLALVERWPGLAALPRVPLVTAPTRVDRLPHASRALGVEVWCKRDDATAPRYGGNKVRKLEWLLGEAESRGAKALVTMGGYGSHHVLATAIYGAERKLAVHAIVFPQPWSSHVETMLRADLVAGAVLHRAPGAPLAIAGLARWTLALRRRDLSPYAIPAGGSSAVGAVGYVAAGVELAGQIARGDCPAPESIYVAAGSGGTVAGLAIGLAACAVTARVVAVRVTPRAAIHRARIGRLARGTVARLRERDASFPDVTRAAMGLVDIDPSQLGRRYGEPTDAGAHATERAAEDGLALDPTYTAKAFAALLAAERTSAAPRLFLSTFSSADMAPLVAGAPPAPPWAPTPRRG